MRTLLYPSHCLTAHAHRPRTTHAVVRAPLAHRATCPPCVSRYSGSVSQREAKRKRENMDENTDLNSAGSIEYNCAKQKVAQTNATATNDMIRHQHAKQGVGKK